MDSSRRVLVAGAGPVGLTAALRLGQLGVPALVLERRMQLGRAVRASVWLPPTLELFERLGILEGLLSTGIAVPRLMFAAAGAAQPLAGFDLGELAGETRFPFRLHVEQGAVAAALAARVTHHPEVRFAFDAEITGIVDTDEGVAVTVQSALGERIERGAVLIAADAAEGVARSLLGIALEEAAPSRRLLEVVTPAELGDALPGDAALCWVRAGQSWCGLVRMPGLWHAAMPLADHEDAEAALEERDLRARLGRFLPFSAGVLPIVARAVRPLRLQVATRFAGRRVLLAGGAAHLVQTGMGLNLNCGLHDAVRAAETGAAVLARPAEATALLARYATARRRVVTAHLLPAAEVAIPGDAGWLAELRGIAADRWHARAWMRAACLLDSPA